jgi:hypothetical protein
MSAKAVVVFDSFGHPLREAEVTLAEEILGLTNSDGYILSPFPGFEGQTYVRVLCSGFFPAVYAITLDDLNQEIHLGGPNNGGNTIYLPPLTSSFKKPSRDRIINVKANLCNIRDADDWPIFEPFIDYLIVTGNPKADDWVLRLKAAGSTHISVTLSGDYAEYLGWANGRYPVPGLDSSNDLNQFASILKWIQSRGLIPIVKLAFDGLRFDPVGWTYGWDWGYENMNRIANGLAEFNESVLWSTGFDGCFPTWTPNQTVSMLRHMRDVLGSKACIDTEFAGPGEVGYIHLGNGASDWHNNQLDILDHFSIELEVNPTPPSPALIDALGQVGERLLNPESDKYYLRGLDKSIAIDLYETDAYWQIRKYLVPQDAKDTADLGKNVGFTVFGNGLPNDH